MYKRQLQTWRASIIPLLAVPVSVIGTFAVLWMLGYSINVLTLFGLVLAIGIVVDDAIVVVENVERHIEEGMAPRAAAHKAMEEVSGPIIAISLVLASVFVPLAFIGGVSGQFYSQFAVTIAASVLISAFNSLTLSPALAAVLLQPRGAPKDRLGRLIESVFGGFFGWFNTRFKRASTRYSGSIGKTISRAPRLMVVYAVLIGVTVYGFTDATGSYAFNAVPVIPQTFALSRALDQPGDIYKLHRRIDYLLRLDQLRQLIRTPRADHHFMAVLQESLRQNLTNHPRTQNTDLTKWCCSYLTCCHVFLC